MNCPTCGATLTDGTTICPTCGAAISQPADFNQMQYQQPETNFNQAQYQQSQANYNQQPYQQPQANFNQMPYANSAGAGFKRTVNQWRYLRTAKMASSF